MNRYAYVLLGLAVSVILFSSVYADFTPSEEPVTTVNSDYLKIHGTNGDPSTGDWTTAMNGTLWYNSQQKIFNYWNGTDIVNLMPGSNNASTTQVDYITFNETYIDNTTDWGGNETGRLWYNNTTQTINYWNGSTVKEFTSVDAVDNGTWKLRAHTTLDADARNITFSGLDLNAHGDVFRLVIDSYNNDSSSATVKIYINGDENDGNYHTRYFQRTSSFSSSAAAEPRLIYYTESGEHFHTEADIDLTFDGYVRIHSETQIGATYGYALSSNIEKTDSTESNITSIKISSAQDKGFKEGSEISLLCMDYGIP